jgi:hypothetical protein
VESLLGSANSPASQTLVTDKLMHTGLGWISMLIAVIATAQQR